MKHSLTGQELELYSFGLVALFMSKKVLNSMWHKLMFVVKQQCMQWEAEKDEVLEMLKIKKLKIEFWMNDKCVPENLKKQIMTDIDLISEENKGADLDDLFSILSTNTKRSLKRFLCMDMLRNVCPSTP